MVRIDHAHLPSSTILGTLIRCHRHERRSGCSADQTLLNLLKGFWPPRLTEQPQSHDPTFPGGERRKFVIRTTEKLLVNRVNTLYWYTPVKSEVFWWWNCTALSSATKVVLIQKQQSTAEVTESDTCWQILDEPKVETERSCCRL